jgi:hypothetical protein
MPVVFKCLCGRTLRVKEDRAGQKVRCPACGEIVTAPQQVQLEAEEVLAMPASGHSPPSPPRGEGKEANPPLKRD